MARPEFFGMRYFGLNFVKASYMLFNRLITAFAFLLLVSDIFGQNLSEKSKGTDYPSDVQMRRDSSDQAKKGEIRIIGDEQISELNVLRSEYPPALNGYRVQIFFGDRQEAIEKKAEFTEKYPDTPTYISFLAPNFRLRVGDFRTKIEAEKLKKSIESDYYGAYIVKDKIELPPLREQKEEIENSEKPKRKKRED